MFKSIIFNGKISVTEAEFRRAKSLNKPMLLYIKKGKVLDDNQKSFLSEITDFYTGSSISYFKNSNELMELIKKDIIRLITSLINGDYRYPQSSLPKLAIFNNQYNLYKHVCKC